MIKCLGSFDRNGNFQNSKSNPGNLLSFSIMELAFTPGNLWECSVFDKHVLVFQMLEMMAMVVASQKLEQWRSRQKYYDRIILFL